MRDRAGVLDRQVGDAARRIEPVRRGKRVGRADRQAARAGAAAVGVRFVGRDVQRGVDLAQEQPGAVRARHQVGVLALPADAGPRRQRLFHHRRGIDEHLHLRPEARHDELRQMLQHALDHVVVVAIARIDRDVAAVGLLQRGQRIAVGRVGQAERDHAARLGHSARGWLRCSARARRASPCRRAARRRRNAASRSRASGPSSARQKPTASKPRARALSRIAEPRPPRRERSTR